jgi:hypothetical protein
MMISSTSMRLMAALILVAAAVSAAPANDLRDGSGTRIGEISADGIVRNARGTKTGSMGVDGSVRNAQGTLTNRIDKNGTIRDASGTKIGFPPKKWRRSEQCC